MEGSRPPEFEVEISSAISAPEAFGASFDVAPLAEALELGEGLEGDPARRFAEREQADHIALTPGYPAQVE